MSMLPKIEKEKLFTIIYADILIFANVALNGKIWVRGPDSTAELHLPVVL